jgi:4-amino-4-deoxy-L-arabinose transferase-like glycosyltransferase
MPTRQPPPRPDSENRGRERRDLLLLACLVLIVYLPGIGARDLWNPDEPRYAVVAREMLEADSVRAWFVPRLNGDLYTQKPPLLFWSMAFFGWLATLFGGGMNEVAARLPSLAAVLIATLGVYKLGRLLFDRQVAWLSAIVFASCFKIVWQGHVGQIDMLLTAMVVLSVYYWARGWVEGRPGLYWLYFVFAGFATLAKGPVGLLPPLLSILVFLGWRDRPALRALPLGRGLLLWVGVVSCWLAPAMIWGGVEYRHDILFTQNVTRYVDPWHHYQPPYYYLGVLPADFLPWSLLLPAALLVGWKGLQGASRERWHFLWIWVALTLVFFSLSSAKRTVYILTLYPALALLVGVGLALIARRAVEVSAWWTRVPALLFTGLCAAAGIAALVLGPGRKEVAILGTDLPFIVGAALLLMAAFLGIGTLHLWRRRVEDFVHWQAAAFGLFAILAFSVVLPRMDVVKSAQPLSERLVSLAREDEPYGIFPEIDATFLYYTRRNAEVIESSAEIKQFTSGHRQVYLLAERDDWNKIKNKPPLYEVTRDADEKEGYILFTNRPLKP